MKSATPQAAVPTWDTVTILGHIIPVARDETGEGYFSPRGVCEALGIDWPRQEKI